MAPTFDSILFSIRAGRERDGDLRATVDPAYLRLHDAFVGGWLALGYRPIEIIRPEIHPASANRRAMFGRDRPVHVIFKPPEEIRILKGACNIGCLSLADPRIRGEAIENRPFSNHVRMLGLLDEIWVGSSAAARIVSEAGLPKVHVVPRPPPSGHAGRQPLRSFETAGIAWLAGGAPTVPASGADASLGGTVFAASFDTLDEMADPETIVDAFLALPENPPSVLLLFCGTGQAFQRLRSCVVERQVAARRNAPAGGGLVGLVSSMGEARARHQAWVDFYICTFLFEGEALPMLEAMDQGCIPVTVRHSAMCDIVDERHPLLIATERSAQGLPRAAPASCASAMRRALSLSGEVRAEMSAHAKRVARNHMSVGPLEARLKALMPPCHV